VARKSVKAASKPVEKAAPVVEERPPTGEDLFRLAQQSPSYEKAVLGQIACGVFSPEGFNAFYKLIQGDFLPEHCLVWVEAIFQALEEKKPGVVIEAFRGSWKTTTLTITFTAWWLGWHPSSSVLLVQVGDDIAVDNTAAVASIIQDHVGWKIAFPNIVPDPDKGWGAGGYEVKRKDIPYARWREMWAARKDPSVLGAGLDILFADP